jgi:hypothetical protein
MVTSHNIVIKERHMRKHYSKVSAERLSRDISYDPILGEFRSVTRRGDVALGELFSTQCKIIDIAGINTTFGRIAWCLGTGAWPLGRVHLKDAAAGFILSNLIDTGVLGPVKKRLPVLTQDRLREVLRYCFASGLFAWNVNASSTGMAGTIAGCLGPGGYTTIRVDGRLYGAHRLAMFYIYGEWPTHMVDHKNHDRSDNRLDNLRQATPGENAQNKVRAIASNQATGLLGVHWSGQVERWGAKVNLDGKQYHAGFYDTPEEAHQAYIEKKRELHPFSML